MNMTERVKAFTTRVKDIRITLDATVLQAKSEFVEIANCQESEFLSAISRIDSVEVAVFETGMGRDDDSVGYPVVESAGIVAQTDGGEALFFVENASDFDRYELLDGREGFEWSSHQIQKLRPEVEKMLLKLVKEKHGEVPVFISEDSLIQ